MTGKIISIVLGLATLAGMTAGAVLWAQEEHGQLLKKKDAVQPQTVQQLQILLEEQIQGVQRQNLMTYYEFLHDQEARARIEYEKNPTDLNRMDLESYRHKREKVMEDLGL